MGFYQLGRMLGDPVGFRFFFGMIGYCVLLSGFILLALSLIPQEASAYWMIACISIPTMIVGYIFITISKAGVKCPDVMLSDLPLYIISFDVLLGIICAISGLIFFTTVFSSDKKLSASAGIVFFVTGFFILHGLYKLYKIFR